MTGQTHTQRQTHKAPYIEYNRFRFQHFLISIDIATGRFRRESTAHIVFVFVYLIAVKYAKIT